MKNCGYFSSLFYGIESHVQEYVLICSCSYNKSYVLKFGRVIHLCFSQIEPRLSETLFALFEGNHYSMNL